MSVIFHASDLHFGAEDSAALSAFAAEVEHERPDAIVITGDLTMRARASEFRSACRWLEQLPAPVSVEVGNHDLPYFNPVARLLRPYRRYGALERLVERPLRLPDVAIVPLRTTARAQWRLNWSKGVVHSGPLREALSGLSAATAPHRIIACHHPLIEAGTRSSASTRHGPAALRRVALSGATAVLSGHVHDPFDLSLNVEGQSIRLIGAGTLSERVRDSRPSYNRLSLDADMMDVQVMTLG